MTTSKQANKLVYKEREQDPCCQASLCYLRLKSFKTQTGHQEITKRNPLLPGCQQTSLAGDEGYRKQMPPLLFNLALESRKRCKLAKENSLLYMDRT